VRCKYWSRKWRIQTIDRQTIPLPRKKMMQLMRDHARTQTNNNNGKEDSKDKRIGPYVVTEKVIGKGTTAEVKLAYNMSCDPKTEAAVKIVNKTVTRKRKEAKKEVKVLQNVEHENIIKLEHVEEDLQYIYIFLNTANWATFIRT